MPKAVVYHKVKKHRMTLKYILTWEYYNGKSVKVLNRYRPLVMILLILLTIKTALALLNPRVIFSKKPIKIKKIARIAYLLGQLF